MGFDSKKNYEKSYLECVFSRDIFSFSIFLESVFSKDIFNINSNF